MLIGFVDAVHGNELQNVDQLQDFFILSVVEQLFINQRPNL